MACRKGTIGEAGAEQNGVGVGKRTAPSQLKLLTMVLVLYYSIANRQLACL